MASATTVVEQQPGSPSQLSIAPCILPPPRSWLVEDDGASESANGSTPPNIKKTEEDWDAACVSSSNRTTLSEDIPADGNDHADLPTPEISETPVTFSFDSHGLHQDSSPPTPVAAPLPSPSWEELSKQVLPAAARELLSSAMQRIVYYSHRSAAACRWKRAYTEYYNDHSMLGYYRSDDGSLPTFSTLPWVERQMVAEWRTYLVESTSDSESPNHKHPLSNNAQSSLKEDADADASEELEFQRARTLVPPPRPRPVWSNSEACATCRKTFGPTLLRHHCRACGHSFCHPHSSHTALLPALSYTIPERVCDACMSHLRSQAIAERIAWRLARCRDLQHHTLAPYFALGVDTVEDAARRITHAALTMAKAVPLGAQATVAVETLDVLRKYGLHGIYTTIVLRQEFLAAAGELW